MKKLIIVGAGLMGRETATWARESGFSVEGFLDSRTEILDGFSGYPPILSSVEDFCVRSNGLFVCAIGDPHVKARYMEMLRMRGGVFATIIHPLAYVGDHVTMGRGCIVAPHATITNDVTIGEGVIVNVNATISHDCRIGSFTTICPGCNIAGGCKVSPCSFLGVHSAMIPNVELGGAGVYVAAGAVVTCSTSATRIMGIPAREK